MPALPLRKSFAPLQCKGLIYPTNTLLSMKNQTIITQVNQVSLNQTIGLAFSNNNTVYKTAGKVVSIKGNTIKVQSEIAFRGYEVGHVFTYSFSKSTKSNHVFEVANVQEVIEFNKAKEECDRLIASVADAYWIGKGV